MSIKFKLYSRMTHTFQKNKIYFPINSHLDGLL